ncbi:MAG: aminotransferase class III-fold pyridoxal phosphate-dependent enzyme, partial [Planctomycetes bacterium]|nr:aminotransferase class III-fold pyridoxal phosphate-dependent enzyme [Planctomycetota bacterium]
MPMLPQTPQINGKLPGPKAAALVARDHAVVSPSYTRSYPLVIDFGEDCMVRDVDGNVFLDYAAGIAVNATGHRHPKVVAALKEGLDEGFIHMSGTDFYYEEQIAYAERIAKAANPNEAMRVFFANSGAEAIEGAIKLARWKTGRTNIISMQGAFHGRTYGALSVGNSKAIHRQRFHPLVAGVHHARYPDKLRGKRTPEQSDAELVEECLDSIRNVIFIREVEPSQVAAILAEPIQGEGGYL